MKFEDKTVCARVYFAILFIPYFFLYDNDACFNNLDFPLTTNNLKAFHRCMQL